jgi:hypothetical protein
LIDRYRLPAYAVGFRQFFMELQERLLRAQSPLLNVLFSGKEPPTRASTVITEQGPMHTEEVEVQFEIPWTPNDYVDGNYQKTLVSLVEQVGSQAASLVPDAIRSMVSQGVLTQVDVASVDDGKLWDLFIDGLKSQPVSRRPDGTPFIEPIICPPDTYRRLEITPRTEDQDRRMQELMKQKIEDFESLGHKRRERKLKDTEDGVNNG